MLNKNAADNEDGSMLILQSLYKERSSGKPVLFVDMGNAFFPGVLSRYSMGSVVYDYLSLNGCAASLVSSNDLLLNVDILLQLEHEREKILLSSNIHRKGKNIFLPYVVKTAGRKKIGIIGLSNDAAVFDITDKSISDIKFEPYSEVMDSVIDKLKEEEKVDYIIVLSGMSLDKNTAVMKAYPDIGFMITGGDSRGELYSAFASRITLNDGRDILMTDYRRGYYKLDCYAENTLKIKSFSFVKPAPNRTDAEAYKKFVSRLEIWKSRCIEEKGDTFANIGSIDAAVDDHYVANLLRSRFKTEIGIVSVNTIRDFNITASTTFADLLDNIRHDHIVYTYKIKGSILKTAAANDRLVVEGIVGDKVQRYTVDDGKYYTIASSQKVYEFISKMTEDSITYKNYWSTISDAVVDDINTKGLVKKKDFSFLDDRYTLYVKLVLSNRLNDEKIKKGDKVTTPVGYSNLTNTQWGIEDSAEVVLYNRYHRYSFSPYISFLEQDVDDDKIYLKNTLRGIFMYTYNYNEMVQPYLKTQFDSVVRTVEKLRPVTSRETGGGIYKTEFTSTKLGIGLEKKIHDTVEPAIYGFEFGSTVSYPFFSYFTYNFIFDSFTSKSFKKNCNYFRADISNGITCKLSAYAALTLKHRYFYYLDGASGQTYKNKAINVSLDINSDWKF